MSVFNARDRFGCLLEQANKQDTTIEEQAEQLAGQRLTLEEIEQTLRDARRKREARYKQAIQRLENDGAPEVLSHDD